MQISTEGKIGLALGLFALAGAAIGLAGAGVQMLAPAYTQIGWLLIVSGWVTFAVAIIGAVALTLADRVESRINRIPLRPAPR
jgi:hypothetical protein